MFSMMGFQFKNYLSIPKTKSMKTVLVYDGDLDPALEEDGFFDYLVPAEKLLQHHETTL